MPPSYNREKDGIDGADVRPTAGNNLTKRSAVSRKDVSRVPSEKTIPTNSDQPPAEVLEVVRKALLALPLTFLEF